jgi:hypothetical protein
MWELLVTKKEKIVLWCMDNDSSSNKRLREDLEGENEPPKKTSRIHTKQALAKEHEVDLKEKHGSTYSTFQYKLWAEMVANESHSSLDEPPAVAMFNRETRQSRSHGQTDAMITVIDKLCAVIPKQETSKGPATSPIRRAELRSTYMKQLNELKSLYENEILTESEYHEQRSELVELMRQLKKT